jgi:cardiolipin synthase A/B
MNLGFLRDLPGWWPLATGAVWLVLSLAATAHVLVQKRDVRAAIAWVGVIWLVPVIGSLLYAMLGLNRIRRRAAELQRARRRLPSSTPMDSAVARVGTESTVPESYKPLARLGEAMSGRPLLTGNAVRVLHNGDEAYPAMLAAIEEARHSIAMMSYIFAEDAAGRPFIDALSRAVKRGVEVRVLVDGVGARYTWPPVHRAMRKAGIRAELFLPGIRDAGLAFFNLRTHRKVLTVDGRVAFTGGINIQARNIHRDNPPRMVRDLHFRLEGPVVGQLQEVFAEDWAFTTREVLDGPLWYPTLLPVGDTTARAFTDGPDGDLEILRTVLLGALASARESVRIVTPYFLPDQGLISALTVAALRGVRVDIVLPAQVNIPLVQWAATAQLWQVLRPGCRVHLTPLPFDHAKLLVVDRAWVLFGSSNWDPRSLRLNFELDVECFDPRLAERLDEEVRMRIAGASELTLTDVDGRPTWKKIGHGFARLFAPYL